MKTNEKDILSFSEVIEILGIKKSTLYKLTSKNIIPCYRPTNGKLFFKREEVLLWLTDSKNQTDQNNNSNLKNDELC